MLKCPFCWLKNELIKRDLHCIFSLESSTNFLMKYPYSGQCSILKILFNFPLFVWNLKPYSFTEIINHFMNFVRNIIAIVNQ